MERVTARGVQKNRKTEKPNRSGRSKTEKTETEKIGYIRVGFGLDIQIPADTRTEPYYIIYMYIYYFYYVI